MSLVKAAWPLRLNGWDQKPGTARRLPIGPAKSTDTSIWAGSNGFPGKSLTSKANSILEELRLSSANWTIGPRRYSCRGDSLDATLIISSGATAANATHAQKIELLPKLSTRNASSHSLQQRVCLQPKNCLTPGGM